MAKNIRVLVHGLGNIGRQVIQSVEAAPDMECVGVVRTPSSVGTKKVDLRGVPDFPGLGELEGAVGKADVAIVCGPSRLAPEDVGRYLGAGLHTVDSFDIHDRISEVVSTLHEKAVAAGRVAVTAAGWDPGTDSVVRALFEAMAPVGTTFTNFGRGRSMGHSVAARAVSGVADAISVTIPIGGGRHSRLVYVLLEEGADCEEVRAGLAGDGYFSHDPLEVRFVGSEGELAAAVDNSHGVLLERIGASGLTSNQRLALDMRIDNPALTGQVMVSCARAACRLGAGCYTLVDIPPVMLLAGERMGNIARLV